MKIEKIDENQVKITLSCAEMLTMNAQNVSAESQNILMELFGALEDEFRFSIINHAIIMEAMPSQKDGCEIFLTKTESNLKKHQNESILVTSFSESEAALYAGRLSKSHVQGRISVYLMNNEYYLTVSSKEQQELAKIQLILCDLGNTVENPLLMEGVLREYGTLILEEDTPPLLN